METVGDYVSLVRGTTYRGDLVGRPGPALLGLGSIEPGGGFRADYKTYGGECPENLLLFPGDLYASLKGATKDGKMIGSVARVPSWVASGRLTQDTVGLKFLEGRRDDASYLYWVLRTPQYRSYCAGRATGSAVVALSRRDFLSYPVPPVTHSRRIAAVLLDAIEQKIELNRQASATLEEMARVVYRSRFVATEGQRTGSLADVAVLNPEVWSKNTMPQLIEYVDLSGTKWGRIESTAILDREVAPSRARRVLRPGDTIVGTVRPGNGSYALVSREGLTGSTGFAVLRPKDPSLIELVYLAATDPQRINELAHLADGAAYPAIRPDLVAATSLRVPQQSEVREFVPVVRPLLARVALNEQQSRTLAALRDTLLARVISGDLRIPSRDGASQS